MTFVVWSVKHGLWWGRDRCGYTAQLAEAGTYTAAQCDEIESNSQCAGQYSEISVRIPVSRVTVGAVGLPATGERETVSTRELVALLERLARERANAEGRTMYIVRENGSLIVTRHLNPYERPLTQVEPEAAPKPENQNATKRNGPADQGEAGDLTHASDA